MLGRMLLAVHEFLNQDFKFSRFPLEVCSNLPHLPEDFEEAACKMISQGELRLVASRAWPDVPALPGRRVPFMAYSEVATTAKKLPFRFRSAVEKLTSTALTAQSTLALMAPRP